MIYFVLEDTILCFQIVPLLHPLGAAVLGVAAVFQGPTFLLKSDDFVAGAAVKAFVQLADG